jgi:hypothetical protein
VYRALCLLVAFSLAGCGLNVSAADLFLLQRTGSGPPLTLLVNDDGTIRCNNGKTRPLANQLLLRARDLATSLDDDVKRNMRLPSVAGTVFSYRIKLQDGTIAFPDKAAASHRELAQVELFAVQAAQSACGVG